MILRYNYFYDQTIEDHEAAAESVPEEDKIQLTKTALGKEIGTSAANIIMSYLPTSKITLLKNIKIANSFSGNCLFDEEEYEELQESHSSFAKKLYNPEEDPMIDDEVGELEGIWHAYPIVIIPDQE